jgi:hypothetical protein
MKTDQFIDYCKKLKVKTSREELEYYDQTGTMFPIARIIYPLDYIRPILEQIYASTGTVKIPDGWDDLEKLQNPRMIVPADFSNLRDEDLPDAIDHELGINPHLSNPSSENFKPWKSYEIIIKDKYGNEIKESSVEHFYSSWQVHRLYELQKIPGFYKYRDIIKISSDLSNNDCIAFYIGNQSLPNYFYPNDHTQFYDALSYFVVIYEREQNRTYSPIPEGYGYKTLHDTQYMEYLERLSHHATFCLKRSGLSKEQMYQSVIELLELHNRYIEDEKTRLANEVEADIFFQTKWIMLVTGKNWDSLIEEFGKLTSERWKEKLRHIDPISKIHDIALGVLINYARNYSNKLKTICDVQPENIFTEGDINQLLLYCEREGLDLLPFTLDEMIAVTSVNDTGNKERMRKRQKPTRYTNLKNLGTTLEYLMKALLGKKAVQERLTLTPLVSRFMKNEPWITLFNERTILVGTKGNNQNEFNEKYLKIRQDKELNQSEDGFWVSCFLTSCLARNLSVHTYPNAKEHWFYEDAIGEMTQAISYSILYAWHIAIRNELIKPFSVPPDN